MLVLAILLLPASQDFLSIKYQHIGAAKVERAVPT
jgi:hypothetical protein